MTRSWGENSDNGKFEVIIDNLMNLEILFWASAKTGNLTLKEIAYNTAMNMGKYWIRPDGSTFHLVVFDPKNGTIISRSGTPQGLAVNSTWARGQAWAIYGFTMAYRYTSDSLFLDYAENVTNYYIANVPLDKVPKWDFDAVSPEDYRDTSAAAITAAGLYELARYIPRISESIVHVADETLLSLSSARYSFLGNTSLSESVLRRCKHDCGSEDCVVVEADYYFLEALHRQAGQLPF